MERLLSYLDDWDDSPAPEPALTYCGHYVVNMVLGMYASLADRQGIEMEINASMPEDVPIRDVDLCVILGNLLENALEASGKIPEDERFVSVQIGHELNQLVILIENRFDGVLNEENGRRLSAKQPGREGLGLRSVLAVCENIGGYAEFYADENGIFHSEVFLQSADCN